MAARSREIAEGPRAPRGETAISLERDGMPRQGRKRVTGAAGQGYLFW